MACDECMMEGRIVALEEDGKRNQTAHREFYNRFEDIKVETAVNNATMMTINTTLSEIRTDVKELKDKPAKRYDAIGTYILTTVIGAALGFLLNGFFPG